ncbi:YcaO-like family protein [Pseudoalteromonas sp. MMG013]|uniref:YcaO-like family protein n=1 Tax=Pseudoalteromonas sp. MMG013 TaxID=2822687 RepID=UPI001B36069A|nr:YcaO-like family protein [Pseudoalteromonas sp. MMG013]MBQ4860693.1 YcaO-like family protein [Pseudoalteromonas sp. MMG013]
MKDLIINWMSSVRPYTLPNHDVVAITDSSEFFFSHVNYPLFYLIDGKKTLSQIVNSTPNWQEKQLFLSRVKALLDKQQYLTESKCLASDYELNNLIIRKNSYVIAPQQHINAYNSLIDRINNTNLNISFVFTTDFRSNNIAEEIVKLPIYQNFHIVSVNQRGYTISPVFHSIPESVLFLHSLLSNQPVLQALENTLNCKIFRPIQYSDNLLSCKADKILAATKKHQGNLKRHMMVFDNEGSVTESYLNLPVSGELPSCDKKLELTSNKVHFDHDGGSRSVSSLMTVQRLMPFVNKVTGYIAHIEPIPQKTNYPIKIYRSAFFKKPAVKDMLAVDENSFVQICLGKGVTEEQSKASALCEAIERKNAQYCGNEQYITKQAKDLPHRYISFDDISPYSDTQYQHFSNKSHSDSQRKQAAVPYSHNEAINWQLVWSLTSDEAVYVPSVLCFANTPFHDDIYGKWNSNGCAAGNNLEEAILQALFELIERDATAIWWYNRLIKPNFDLSRLNPDYLAPLDQTLREHHDYWVLDLTIDTGVAVMAAIGKHKTTQGWIFGFGCHLKPEMAAQRALTELCQLIPIRDQNGAPFDFDAISDDDFLNPHDATAHGAYTLTQSGDLKDDIIAITEQLELLGLETLVLDYTRQPLPIHTAKVFVPGLCHIWPQLGNARLYQTPVKLGWLEEPLNEQTINQQGLYI